MGSKGSGDEDLGMQVAIDRPGERTPVRLVADDATPGDAHAPDLLEERLDVGDVVETVLGEQRANRA